MKKSRIVCFLLAACMFLQMLPTSIYADHTTPIFVQACYVPDGSMEALQLLNLNGEAYIRAEDLARFADMNLSIEQESLKFRKDTCSFEQTIEAWDMISGTGTSSYAYVPLKESTEKLFLSYYYDKENQILLFNPREVFVEELVDLCDSIYKRSSGYSPYDVGYIYETSLAWVATLYNVFTGGEIIDWAFGVYDKEQYEKAIGTILTNEDGGKSEIEQFLSDCRANVKTVMKQLSQEDKLEVQSMEWLESQGVDLQEQFIGYLDIFARPYQDAVAVYKAANTVKGLTPGDLLDLYHNVNLKNEAVSLYLKAFRYGLGENKKIENKALRQASRSMYAFTKENEMDTAQILSDAIGEIAYKNISANISDEILKSCGIKTNGIAVAIATWVTNQFVADKTQAVDQAKAYAGIQIAIEDMLKNVGDPKHKLFDPIALKYAMILYVRACQCCFDNFREIEGTEDAAKQMIQLSKNEILKLAVFEDDQLTMKVENEPIDFTLPGFTTVETEINVFTNEIQKQIAEIPHAAAAYLLGNDGNTVIHRLDSNGDGVEEWILKKAGTPAVWCIMDGSSNYILADVFAFTDIGQETGVYQSQKTGDIILQGLNNLKEAYWIYDKGIGLPFLYCESTNLWSNGERYINEEYAMTILEDYTLLDISDRAVTDMYDFSLELLSADIRRVTEQLKMNTNVTSAAVMDLNGDGLEDGVIFYNDDFTLRSYVDGKYEYTDLVTCAESCAALLLSENGKTHVKIVETAEAEAMMQLIFEQQEVQRLASEALAAGMGNGIYSVILRADQVAALSSGGWTATVGRQGYVTYSDSEIQALAPGAVLGGVTVQTIRRDSSQIPKTVMINGGEIFLVQHEDGLWYHTLENDRILIADLGSITLPISPAVICYDEQPGAQGLTKNVVSGMDQLFAAYGTEIETSVTVNEGIITEIVRTWRP